MLKIDNNKLRENDLRGLVIKNSFDKVISLIRSKYSTGESINYVSSEFIIEYLGDKIEEIESKKYSRYSDTNLMEVNDSLRKLGKVIESDSMEPKSIVESKTYKLTDEKWVEVRKDIIELADILLEEIQDSRKLENTMYYYNEFTKRLVMEDFEKMEELENLFYTSIEKYRSFFLFEREISREELIENHKEDVNQIVWEMVREGIITKA
ncbi:hypothetical protein [Staphylococcus phage vB_StaM_SA1]|nr:hypothetical protein [Staphylococcus phage vB_StaM_SA1]